MRYLRTGMPEEGEILLCTVTKIQYSSVFVNIDEYKKSGMIHISEIAAGRIRNIRDYVKEGKKVVCKVLRIHEQKGHIDLSLRRVSDNQRKNKVNDLKLEQTAESVIEYIAKEHKLKADDLYDKIALPLLEKYEYIHHAFQDVVEGNVKITFGLDPKIEKEFVELITQRFKPKPIELHGKLQIICYESNGLEIVQKALDEAQKISKIPITYLGGGKYRLTVNALEYKDAEELLDKTANTATTLLEKHKCKVQFIK